MMYRDLLCPRPFNPTAFANDAGYDKLVIVRDIPFVSLCRHHVLPFHGVVSLGYLPGSRIVGLSKLARLVHYFARSFQVQEQLTKQIADWMQENLSPRGVVILRAEHQCMTMPGPKIDGVHTVNSTMYGLLREKGATRQEFLTLAGLRK
ncbi:MAG: GTP cyclohydrolase I [Actinomycetota bacterium]|nr:GTP cyclohydrolase I [Actinomycetota bacterium]